MPEHPSRILSNCLYFTEGFWTQRCEVPLYERAGQSSKLDPHSKLFLAASRLVEAPLLWWWMLYFPQPQPTYRPVEDHQTCACVCMCVRVRVCGFYLCEDQSSASCGFTQKPCRDMSKAVSPALGFQVCIRHAQFFCVGRFRWSNSGPQTWVTSTLPIKLLPQHSILSFRVSVRKYQGKFMGPYFYGGEGAWLDLITIYSFFLFFIIWELHFCIYILVNSTSPVPPLSFLPLSPLTGFIKTQALLTAAHMRMHLGPSSGIWVALRLHIPEENWFSLHQQEAISF